MRKYEKKLSPTTCRRCRADLNGSGLLNYCGDCRKQQADKCGAMLREFNKRHAIEQRAQKAERARR